MDIEEDVSVHMQMKDLFSGDADDFLHKKLLEIHKEHNLYLVLELVGFDDRNKLEYVLGHREESLFKMIQHQVSKERDEALAT